MSIDMTDYARNYASHYTADIDLERILVKYRREQVLNSLVKFPHSSILETGCGMEPFFCCDIDFSRYTVIEPCTEFVTHAEKCSNGDSRISILNGFFESITSDLMINYPFDFIIVSSLLHEVPDPKVFLKSLRKNCTDQTVVHLNVPNVYSFHRLLAVAMGLIGSIYEKSATENRFGRHSHFDRNSLVNLCEHHGFSIISSRTYFIKPFTHQQLEYLLKTGFMTEQMIEGLSRLSSSFPEHGCEICLEMRPV
ncbi:MAG TPA: methyltransferase domain-containing protein [Chitinispirillaceae bacterium]|nr:methyltransferase domain-containing protein [Chitinispirillaceae bacterium]